MNDYADARRYATDIDVHGADAHALVVRQVPPGSTVLELGCAVGSMTRVLRERGCDVTAVEIDPEAAARAAGFAGRLLVADLDVADLGELLGDETYDVVVAADVLEHLRDPGRVLDAVRDRLRPGGRLVASIPNVAHAAVRLALLGGGFPYDKWGLLDRTHVRFFTHDSLHETLAGHGFTVRSTDRVEVPLDEAGVRYDAARLPAGLAEWACAQPEALTYQFVVVAEPATAAPAGPAARAGGGPEPVPDLAQRQGRALAEADAEVAELRERLRLAERDVAYRDGVIAQLQATAAFRTTAALRSLKRALTRRRRRTHGSA